MIAANRIDHLPTNGVKTIITVTPNRNVVESKEQLSVICQGTKQHTNPKTVNVNLW